jgi:hypothetical protein
MNKQEEKKMGKVERESNRTVVLLLLLLLWRQWRP